MKLYFDTSALTKRYREERGSDRVESLFLEAASVFVSIISLPEIISALARLLREKKLSPHQYSLCKKTVIEDFSAFEVCQISAEVLKTSILFLEESDLRAADALHLACAMEAKAARFVSGDAKQIAAAKKFGLRVEAV